MQNPWRNLNTDVTSIHPLDMQAVDEFNSQAKEEYQFCKTLLPDPYIGNLKANVLFLALNPGLSAEDYQTHADEQFRFLYKQNLTQVKSDYPFYYLHPELNCPGSKWWRSKLRWFLEVIDDKSLSKRICCLQYMPYHSVQFKQPKQKLPTQEYTKEIVKSFIERNTPIVFMRSKTKWIELVPELENYQKAFVLRNPRNPTFSPKNMEEENFNRLINTLKI
ncbi:hypothetical protein [Marinifilum flexuosum]|uniref:Uracil DNA glycosylase superfamily protein n=1 Tax=Marinifilum flexuosum TaxID=1117708 RepID=A0A419X8Y8_9BACT|nr:hypothetical protein [Marinifilum flexuosum]RKE04172.1 hypothetical protein BXY64_1188 [Marinifilum flexuosum]